MSIIRTASRLGISEVFGGKPDFDFISQYFCIKENYISVDNKLHTCTSTVPIFDGDFEMIWANIFYIHLVDNQSSIRLCFGLYDIKTTLSNDREVNITGLFQRNADWIPANLNSPLIRESCSRFESIGKFLLSRVLCFLLSLLQAGTADSEH